MSNTLFVSCENWEPLLHMLSMRRRRSCVVSNEFLTAWLAREPWPRRGAHPVCGPAPIPLLLLPVALPPRLSRVSTLRHLVPLQLGQGSNQQSYQSRKAMIHPPRKAIGSLISTVINHTTLCHTAALAVETLPSDGAARDSRGLELGEAACASGHRVGQNRTVNRLPPAYEVREHPLHRVHSVSWRSD